VYLSQREIAERSDTRIEEQMLAFERGEVDVDKVQQVSKQGIILKYKAELATQQYQKTITQMNQFLSEFPLVYKPELSRLQSLEEARIGFQKFVMDKFIQTLSVVGQTVNFVTS
jgi:hypothetical protein